MINYFRLSENENCTLEKISEFNDDCFPIRKPHRFYDIYRFIQNPFATVEKDFIYSVEKDGKYVAQMLTMPVPLSLNEEIIPAFWGQDYFVLEENRGEGIGKELANYYLKKDYYIAVGFSSKSAVIHQKMGAKKIGYLDFYQKWASPLLKIKWLIKRGLKIKPKKISAYRFPNEINEFERVEKVENLHFPQLNWNKNTLETIRNPIYFQWRFFFRPNRYFVYQSKNKTDKNACYFVCKPYFYRGVNWLKVVDYRFDNSQIQEFKMIVKAAEKLRKQFHLFGILIPSSQKITKNELEKKNFKRYKHEIVLTTFPFQHEETDEAHNHFIISFADSDMDMHNYLGRFNFGEELK
jgi:hypothetical protein